jgi:hypothetical protein
MLMRIFFFMLPQTFVFFLRDFIVKLYFFSKRTRLCCSSFFLFNFCYSYSKQSDFNYDDEDQVCFFFVQNNCSSFFLFYSHLIDQCLDCFFWSDVELYLSNCVCVYFLHRTVSSFIVCSIQRNLNEHLFVCIVFVYVRMSVSIFQIHHRY